MTPIKIEPAKHSDALLSAVEATLRAHQLRLKAGQTLGHVIDAIEGHGFKLSAQHGYLDATQTISGSELPAHVNAIFEGIAEKESERFFPRNVGHVRSRDAMDRQGRVQYIAEYGLKAFEALPQTANPNLPVVLSPDMTKQEYLSLDRATKSALCGEFGADAIAKILSRK